MGIRILASMFNDKSLLRNILFPLQEDYYCRGPNQKAWPIRWMAPEQIVVQGRSVLDSMSASTAGNFWWVGLVGGGPWLLC